MGKKQSLDDNWQTVRPNIGANSASTELLGTKEQTAKIKSSHENSKVSQKFPGETAEEAKSKEQ